MCKKVSFRNMLMKTIIKRRKAIEQTHKVPHLVEYQMYSNLS